MTRRIYRASVGVVLLSAMLMSAVWAADIQVTTTNDSGTGSLRQGLSTAKSGDTLQFQSVLNGTTLVNGASLVVGTAVTFTDTTTVGGIVLTDNHAYSLADPISVAPVPPSKTTTFIAVPLTIDWAGTLTLNGILSDTTSGGSLIKTGSGVLELTNANTYTGIATGTSTTTIGTTLSGGTLYLTNSSAIGTGALSVSTSGTTLQLGNSINLTNAVVLSSALTVNTNPNTTEQLSGVISESTAGSGKLLFNGNGTGELVLSGTNTFTGGVTASNGGTLSLQSSAALGTGALTTTTGLSLLLGSGISVSNSISLGGDLTANVASGSATISGNITGSDALTKTGTGTLVLSGTNTYTGATISQGTLQLQGNSTNQSGTFIDNGSLIFTPGASTGTFGGTVTGTGSMTINGTGTLIFSGMSSLNSTTTVSSGELQVTGSLNGPVNVASTSGTLSGTGTVGDVTNSGIVQPGTTSIGTLTVSNYTQQSGGTTEIKLGPASNDVLTVNGPASLNGALSVLTQSGFSYSAGTQYTMLNSTGGVTGQFAQAYSNLAAYGVIVTYDANDVKFQLQPTTSLSAAAQTANQASLATVFDQISTDTSAAMYQIVNILGVQTPAEQRQAMNQLSGEMFGNMETLGLQIGDQFQQRVTSTIISNGRFLVGQDTGQSSNPDVRGQSPPIGGSRAWTQGFGVSGNLRSDGNASSLNYSQGGGIYGVDMAEDDTGRLGFTGGNSYVGFTDGFGGKGQVTAYQIGMYALKHDDEAYVLGTANYGFNQYGTNRNLSIAGVNQSLQSSFTGSQIGANAEAGLKLAAGVFHFQPLIGLQYLYLCQQGFDESGGSMGLLVPRDRANSLRANIGARVIVDSLVGPRGAVWTPYTHVRFVTDLLDNDRVINATFNGATTSGAFTSQGTRIGQSYGVIGEGAEVRLNEAWSLYGGGDVMLGDRITIATGSIAAITTW